MGYSPWDLKNWTQLSSCTTTSKLLQGLRACIPDCKAIPVIAGETGYPSIFSGEFMSQLVITLYIRCNKKILWQFIIEL